MATGKGDREAELEAAIKGIRLETWKAGQTLPKLRHAIALILQELETLMPIFGDMLMVKDGSRQRAVAVTIIAPEGMNIRNVKELAQRAWQSPNKEIKVGHGRVTVRVRAFRCKRSMPRK